jgi:hypothetical protein
MANMETTDRAQYERADLKAGGESFRRGTEKGRMIYMAFAVVIAVALSYATLEAMDGWWQWLVFGVIVMTTMGMIIAINPARRQAG